MTRRIDSAFDMAVDLHGDDEVDDRTSDARERLPKASYLVDDRTSDVPLGVSRADLIARLARNPEHKLVDDRESDASGMSDSDLKRRLEQGPSKAAVMADTGTSDATEPDLRTSDARPSYQPRSGAPGRYEAHGGYVYRVDSSGRITIEDGPTGRGRVLTSGTAYDAIRAQLDNGDFGSYTPEASLAGESDAGLPASEEERERKVAAAVELRKRLGNDLTAEESAAFPNEDPTPEELVEHALEQRRAKGDDLTAEESEGFQFSDPTYEDLVERALRRAMTARQQT